MRFADLMRLRPKRLRIGSKVFSGPTETEKRMVIEAAQKRRHRIQQGWQPVVPQTWRSVEDLGYRLKSGEVIPVYRRNTRRGHIIRIVSKRVERMARGLHRVRSGMFR